MISNSQEQLPKEDVSTFTLSRIFSRSKSKCSFPERVNQVAYVSFVRKYKKSLKDMIKGDTSGEYEKLLLECIGE
jgi:hypothetical protein